MSPLALLRWYGGASVLTLQTREIGRVTVVRCAGRIVLGDPSESLRAHVTHLLRDRRALVLHLGGVGFVDSSGLGTMVRLLTATRQSRGDLKLCALPVPVQALLKMTTTQRLFDIHESEESAVAAFYNKTGPAPAPTSEGPTILCVHKSADVLAYLREFLRHAGYDVQTTCAVRDALLLLRVAHPRLVVLGHDVGSNPERKTAIESACANIPCISLSEDFSTLDAGEAAEAVLHQVHSRLLAFRPIAPSPPSSSE
jgi:anti-sigma B factor antagonist